MEGRRGFLKKMAGVWVLVGLAGCNSRRKSDGTDTQPTSTASPTAVGTQSDMKASTKGESPTETSEGSEDSASGDQVLDGEQRLEEVLTQQGYHWFELEQPTEQVQNINPDSATGDFRGLLLGTKYSSGFDGDEMVDSSRDGAIKGSSTEFKFIIDSVYFGLRKSKSSSVYTFGAFAFNSEKWTQSEGISFTKENGIVTLIGGDVSRDVIKKYIDKNVSGYDDISDGFPSDLKALLSN